MTRTISLYYFPKGLRYVTPFSIVLGAFLIYLDYRVWGSVLLILSAFILTAKYITIIDLGKKEIIDAFRFFAISVGQEQKRFHKLNRIIITKGNYSQTINTRAQSRQLDWSDYTGTLIYDDIATLDLVTTQDKDKLVNDLKIYATSLTVSIEDSATGRLIFSPSSI